MKRFDELVTLLGEEKADLLLAELEDFDLRELRHAQKMLTKAHASWFKALNQVDAFGVSIFLSRLGKLEKSSIPLHPSTESLNARLLPVFKLSILSDKARLRMASDMPSSRFFDHWRLKNLKGDKFSYAFDDALFKVGNLTFLECVDAIFSNPEAPKVVIRTLYSSFPRLSTDQRQVILDRAASILTIKQIEQLFLNSHSYYYLHYNINFGKVMDRIRIEFHIDSSVPDSWVLKTVGIAKPYQDKEWER